MKLNYSSKQCLVGLPQGSLLENETSSILGTTSPENYTVIVSNGSCSATSDPHMILVADEINRELKMYPNPVSESIYLELPPRLEAEVRKIQIRDITDKSLRKVTYQKSIELSQLKNGIYFLELIGDDFVVTKRFLKK